MIEDEGIREEFSPRRATEGHGVREERSYVNTEITEEVEREERLSTTDDGLESVVHQSLLFVDIGALLCISPCLPCHL